MVIYQQSMSAMSTEVPTGEPIPLSLAERAYDFIDPSQLPPVPGCSLLYHGSLALRGATSKSALGSCTFVRTKNL